MTTPRNGPPERENYLEALRWRKQSIQSELAKASADREAIASKEAALVNQLRAVDELLAAEPHDRDPLTDPSELRGGLASQQTTDPAGAQVSGDLGPLIYSAAQAVLREAGGALHYREIAERVMHRAPLRGKDPAATLLAYMSKASDRFIRIARGTYSLPSGNNSRVDAVLQGPARKRKRKRRAKRPAQR